MSGHLPSYSKIYSLGHAAVSSLFDVPVVLEEKVDGSQFSFGIIDGELRCRSKGKDIDMESPEKMFEIAVRVIREREEYLQPGWTYRAEFLQKPKHNTLAYDRVPANHLVIFDIDRGIEDYLSPAAKVEWAEIAGFECVPMLAEWLPGEQRGPDDVAELLKRVSFLGGQNIEGVVFKAYGIYDKSGKTLMAKHVSEEFKEVHRSDWKERNRSQGDVLELLGQAYRSEARWNKAIQRLRDSGELTDSPKDIGRLMPSVRDDVLAECEEEIKNKLFKWAWDHISRRIVAGLPEWYKNKLVEKQFEDTRV